MLRPITRMCFVLGLSILLLISGSPASAEVGVAIQLGVQGEIPSLYVVGSIYDDPDPVGRSWRRYVTDSNARAVLNDQGEVNGDGKPTTLFNTVSGLPIVAWSQNSPSGFDIVLSQYSAGAWSAPIVLADSPADELDPHLVMNPADGTVHLLYWIDDGDPRVMRRQAPADLSSWTVADRISSSNEIAVRPAGTFHMGALAVVYESHAVVVAGTPRQIVVALEQPGGFDTETISSTHHSDANWPEAHSALGRLWVEWVDQAGEMAWTRQQGGGWEPIAVEYFSGTEDRDYHARGRIKAQATE